MVVNIITDVLTMAETKGRLNNLNWRHTFLTFCPLCSLFNTVSLCVLNVHDGFFTFSTSLFNGFYVGFLFNAHVVFFVVFFFSPNVGAPPSGCKHLHTVYSYSTLLPNL